MFTSLKNKEVKIKKARKCWGCATLHYPGTKMKYSVCVSEDGLATSYWCEICDAYLDKHRNVFTDGVSQYEFHGEDDWKQFRDTYLLATRKVFTEKYNKWALISNICNEILWPI